MISFALYSFKACDGKVDCRDGSDESVCSFRTNSTVKPERHKHHLRKEERLRLEEQDKRREKMEEEHEKKEQAIEKDVHVHDLKEVEVSQDLKEDVGSGKQANQDLGHHIKKPKPELKEERNRKFSVHLPYGHDMPKFHVHHDHIKEMHDLLEHDLTNELDQQHHKQQDSDESHKVASSIQDQSESDLDEVQLKDGSVKVRPVPKQHVPLESASHVKPEVS